MKVVHIHERDYRRACTDLRATSTSLLFTYTHSHAWATAESAMAISTFSMFDPSVGTLKGPTAKNKICSDDQGNEGFPTTYHSLQS